MKRPAIGDKAGGNRKAKLHGHACAMKLPVIGITGIASVLYLSHPESPPDGVSINQIVNSPNKSDEL
jgi:hypothetical protein